MLASDVLDKAEILLLDESNDRWTEAELLGWLTDGLRALANLRPYSVASKTVETLVTGSRQAVPTGSFLLLDILRNMGADGATPGKPIRRVDSGIQRAFGSTWHSADDGAAVANFTYDPDLEPLVYHVVPRIPSTPVITVEMIHAVTPSDVAATSSTLPVNEEYEQGLVDYVLYRAFSKDSEFAENERADYYYKKFLATTSVAGHRV